ncbi:hypothetical protein SCYAM73S_07699 [Streptomyces cyaneofuscatus]
MSTLTVWKFTTAEGAESAEETLKALQKEGLIRILDAAVVSWPADRAKPRTKQLLDLVGAGALSGTFWGMLFGLIFLMPLLGAAVGRPPERSAGSSRTSASTTTSSPRSRRR